MHITIENLYSGKHKDYKGSPVDVEYALVKDYPWVGHYRQQISDIRPRLRQILATLGRAQALMVHIQDNDAADEVEHHTELYKSVAPEAMPKNFGMNSHGKTYFDTSAEPDYDHPHQTLAKDYHSGVIDNPADIKPRHKHDMEELGRGMQPKVVFDNIPTHIAGGSSFLVKPYIGSSDTSTSGWQEMTSQDIYHAVGMGEYHQKVHVAHHLVSSSVPHEPPKKIPVTVHHLETEHVPLCMATAPIEGKYRTDHKEARKKMYILDFLMNQKDRHDGNVLLHKETGKPLAIDNGEAFASGGFKTNGFLQAAMQDSALHHISAYNVNEEAEHKSFKEAFNWWKQNSSKATEAFTKRTALIKDNATKREFTKNFHERARKLDELAEKYGK